MERSSYALLVPSYAAFIGHQPVLSRAEWGATVPDLQLEAAPVAQILFFNTEMELQQKHVDRLGGTILLCKKIVDEGSLSDIPAILAKELANAKGKVTFSLRGIGVHPPKLKDLYRECKNLLRKKGQASRYVGNEHKPAASALLHDAGILDPKTGCELTIIVNNEQKFFWVGRTVGAQDPNRYAKRDMEKPVRDTRVGLLPPKLAQMMLNLGLWMVAKKTKNGELPKEITVFDPFCGTGVIPMEAMLRGFNVLGSDSSIKAVTGCEKNVDWLRKEYGILKKDVTATIWKHDALKAFELKEMPNVVVTETTLGPPLKDRPTVRDTNSMRSDADTTEIAFLKNAAATLPGVPLVVTFPFWQLKTGPVMLERVWKALETLPYKAVLPPGITPENKERPCILYRRPDTIVGRQIVLLLPS